MKLTVIIAALALTEAIRVPPSWTDEDKFATNSRPSVGSETRTNVVQKHWKRNRHPNLKKADFKASATTTEWKPIFPFVWQPNQEAPPTKRDRHYKIWEPTEVGVAKEKHVHREKPISDHEVALDIPTRPIYPGEGRWAKKGPKHAPFISKHRFSQPEEEDDESDDVPPGYETFAKNTKLFETQRDKFRDDIDEFPQRHNLETLPQQEEEEEDDADEEEDDEEQEASQEFVPTRTYSQVRRSENEEHLPGLVEDPRLREVIKDSKIQTVYTEEGYEDLAYDHAGHEKTAEEDEGYAEFDKEIERERKRKILDSDAQGSQNLLVRRPSRMRKDQLVKTKKVQTVVKNFGDEKLEVGEAKVTASPTNFTKTEELVKIFPKEYRYDVPTTEATVDEGRRKTRSKRYANDFPDLSVDTDFIDKINHHLPERIVRKEEPKYPYYDDPNLHPYSPLRYAENLDNIPKKTEDALAFYNQAEKIECPEVETDVDPIPKRVKNADEDPENAEDNSDVQELVKGPRLKGLGDKIDCFKVKYFGEDPLDSPFFQEKELGPVLPLFQISSKKVKVDFKPNEIEEKASYSTKVVQRSKKDSEVTAENLNILTDIIKQFKKPQEVEAATSRTALKLEIVDSRPAQSVSVENQTEAAVISIITTPKYTIDLKPRHIYHQIELLQYLPYGNATERQNTTEEVVPNVKTQNITEEPEAPNARIGKSLEEPTPSTPTDETSPESQALRYRRPRPRPTPYYQVFDVNKYLPQNPYSVLLNQIRTTTFPKRDIRSEVNYKNAIKATQQLNVFADVINNIKNSSRDPQQIAASSNYAPTKLTPFVKYRKIPVVESDLDDIEETNSFYVSTTTTRPVKYSSYTSKEDLFEDLANRDRAKYENLELLKIKRLTTTTEPYSSDNRSSFSVDEEEEEEEEEVEEEEVEDTTRTVLGLMPPGSDKYTTIVRPQPTNLFYVLGMKPPPLSQQVYSYSDFKPNAFDKVKYSHLRRGRRSAQRPSYSEVVRNRNKPIDVQDDIEVVVEDDDDYVPHRPKNYHYDEKTGRIVYEKVEIQTEDPEEEFIEVTEAPIPKPTRRNSVSAPKFANFTGPSFVDFIKLVKSNANYTEIPDPPPTEKNEDVETTTTMTTAKPASTNPPEFLNFLSKVRSASNYKAITEKTTNKTKTTTQALEEIEEEREEEEETQLENVQNSPGGQTKVPGFQIFDINEYLPKVKNYSPRTSIDYSKYKTIERQPVPLRHNLSSRYNSDEEELEDVKTVRVPILLDDKKEDPVEEINPVMSESKHEDVEPSTATPTTEVPSTPFPVRRRTRPISRTTRRTTTASSVTTEEPTPVVHDKPKRVFPRRRASRIKINRTTTEVPDAEVEESTSAKVVRRRHQKNEDFTTTSTAKPKAATKPPKKDADVQVFHKVNQTKKHGGNYRKEEDESESKKVQRLTDVVQKPSAFYMDPKLPKKINQLVEARAGDVEDGEGGEDEVVEAGYDYEGAEEKGETTKKPVFVKDPDKRLYYYAPI